MKNIGKLIKVVVIAAGVAVMAGCAKEAPTGEIPEVIGKKAMTVTAARNDLSGQTRTELAGGKVRWKSDDRLGLYVKALMEDGGQSVSPAVNSEFSIENIDEESGVATFEGEYDEVSGAVGEAGYYVYTPWQAGAGDDPSGLKLLLPSIQQPSGSSFDGDADIMFGEPVTTKGLPIGEMDGNGKPVNFVFERPFAIGAFRFTNFPGGEDGIAEPGEEIVLSAKLTFDEGLEIAGNFTADITRKEHGVAFDNGVNTIELTYTDEITLDGFTAWWIMAPATVTEFTAQIETTNYSVSKKFTVAAGLEFGANSINRSDNVKMTGATVVKKAADPLIYKETFDAVERTTSTNIAWNDNVALKDGKGGENAVYDFTKAHSSPLSKGYRDKFAEFEGASGENNIRFTAPNEYFSVSGIATGSATGFNLAFNYVGSIRVLASKDGGSTWATVSPGTAKTANYSTAAEAAMDFSIAEALAPEETLTLRFIPAGNDLSTSNAARIDDITLSEADAAGPELDFDTILTPAVVFVSTNKAEDTATDEGGSATLSGSYLVIFGDGTESVDVGLEYKKGQDGAVTRVTTGFSGEGNDFGITLTALDNDTEYAYRTFASIGAEEAVYGEWEEFTPTKLVTTITFPFYVGFETSEGFVNGSGYQADEKSYGSNFAWKIDHGTPTTTDKYSGDMCLQMRIYTSDGKKGYAFTDYDIPGEVEYFTFTAKNNDAKVGVKVQYSTDGGNSWIGDKDYILTSSVATYIYEFPESVTETDNVRVRFNLTCSPDPTGTHRLTIDDVTFYNVPYSADPEEDLAKGTTWTSALLQKTSPDCTVNVTGNHQNNTERGIQLSRKTDSTDAGLLVVTKSDYPVTGENKGIETVCVKCNGSGTGIATIKSVTVGGVALVFGSADATETTAEVYQLGSTVNQDFVFYAPDGVLLAGPVVVTVEGSANSVYAAHIQIN